MATRRHIFRHGLWAAALVGAAACASAPLAEEMPPLSLNESSAPPKSCRNVRASEPLQKILDAADPGDSFCLAPGTHRGPIIIRQPLTLWGPTAATLAGKGQDTTLLILASGVTVRGFSVVGSGPRYDHMDAAVAVRGSYVNIESLTIRSAMFGILVDRSDHVVLDRNIIWGPDEGPLGLRGDTIRLWETHHSLITNNWAIGGRDMVVWYSSHNHIERNHLVRGRYGTHLMYSHDNEVRGNHYQSNIVGIFVMYSRNVTVADNVLTRAHGSGGMGLGCKEAGNLTVENNRFVGNTTALYLDTSPLYEKDHNVFQGNSFWLSGVGVAFHGTNERNRFLANSFRDNDTHVDVDGGNDALAVTWEGNSFDDYTGYDLDGDRVGDLPYELRSFSQDLTSKYPTLAYFKGSFTLTLIEAVSRVFPLFKSKTILLDSYPSFRPLTQG